jgi:hypothetical protein
MDISKVGAQSGQQVYWSLIRALKSFPYNKQVQVLKAAYPDITQSEIEYYIGPEPKPTRQVLPDGYVVVAIEGTFSWEDALAAGIFTHADDKSAYLQGVNFLEAGDQCNISKLNENATPEKVQELQEYALQTGRAVMMPIDKVPAEMFESEEVYQLVISGSV